MKERRPSKNNHFPALAREGDTKILNFRPNASNLVSASFGELIVEWATCAMALHETWGGA